MDVSRNTLPGLAAALASGVLLAVGGCQSREVDYSQKDWNDAARRDTNAWLIQTYQGQQIENAVTRQHTLWSHHFIEGTTTLSPRGERDLGILRDHYLRHDGGVLTIRQGEAGDELFERRVRSVTDWLTGEGVRMDRVALTHDLFTGEGKRSTVAAEAYVTPSSEEPYTFHQGSDK